MVHTIRVIIGAQHLELTADEDTDRDGRPDSATIEYQGHFYRFTDVDLDGYPDVIRVIRPDQSRQVLVRDEGALVFRVLSDSAAADRSMEESASHWFAQATTHTCGPAAITMVLADLFNLRLPNENEVWRRAVELGAMTPEGMPARDLERVIESYGIPARTVQSSVHRLEEMLELGHEVILMVDAHDYWPEFAGHEAELRAMPHAVRVLAIDVDAGVAILSDSGRPDPLFSRLEVPLETLNQAWADLEWMAVVTEVTHDEVRTQLRAQNAAVRRSQARLGAGSAEFVDVEAHHLVFLPVSVRLRRMLRSLGRRLGAPTQD